MNPQCKLPENVCSKAIPGERFNDRSETFLNLRPSTHNDLVQRVYKDITVKDCE